MSQRSLILIGGPTASGKSARAMELARTRNGSIINADAMQVYAGLPLLTAQPEPEDRAEIPHFLYEVTDPSEASSAGKWLAQAQKAIADVYEEGRTPIVVGGTGLYFEALRGGLADIPVIPESVRLQTQGMYRALGEEKFRQALAQKDPESASRIARNDRQRLIRAYEVVEHTGRALTDWHRSGPEYSLLGTDENIVPEYHLLMPAREALYAACDKRFTIMVERGAIDEVTAFLKKGLSPTLPSMKILGVRELASYVRGETSLDKAIALAQQKTRNYAKRQMTWFRNRWENQLDYGKDSLNEKPI